MRRFKRAQDSFRIRAAKRLGNIQMPSPKDKAGPDAELRAIQTIMQALDGLDGDALQRVIAYVFNRLSISTPSRLQVSAPTGATSAQGPSDTQHRSHAPSIRDLKEEKKPESSNQMAAIVAYYLSEIEGTKQTIGTADIEKYFKQAAFKLPKKIQYTLPNAAAAGYFEAEGNGVYRLNPVGYNLVVHGLPRPHGAGEPQRTRRTKSPSKRRSK
jgi:hypothetical protein